MAEVGSAYITIIPTMKGATQRLSNELNGISDDAGKQAGGKFGGGLFKSGAVFGAFSALATKAFNAVGASIGGAVARVDTLANFPKTMGIFGYSSDVATKAITKMKNRIQGLPTTLDGISGAVQGLTAVTGDLGKSTDVALAFNDMLLGAGQSGQVAAGAMEQFRQILSQGKPDLMSWRIINSAMPGQMKQLAEAMLGAGATADDLYKALGGGGAKAKISMDQLMQKMVEMDQKGSGAFKSFAEQANISKDNIGTAMSNIQNRVSQAVARVIDEIGRSNITGAIEMFSKSFDKIADPVVGGVKIIKGAIDGIDFGKLQSACKPAADAISGLAQAFKDAAPPAGVISKAISDVVNAGIDRLDALINPKDGADQIWQAVAAGVGAAATSFWALANAAGAFAAIKAAILGLDIVKWAGDVAAAIQLIAQGNGVLSTISTLIGGACAPWMLIAAAIVGVVAALAWFFTQTELGKQLLAMFVDAVGGFFLGLWDNIQKVWAMLCALVDTVAGWIGNIVSIVQAGFALVLSIVQTTFGNVCSFISGAWSNIVGFFSAGIESAKSFISNGLTAIAGFFSGIFGGIVGTVQGIFNNIKGAIEGPMNTAKGVVKGIIDAIKGFFSFKISWPKIPLPHFSVSPSGWQIGDLLKGSFPKLGISWYAKGGFVDGAQLIGAGERGAELITPMYDPYMTKYAQAIGERIPDRKDSIDYDKLAYILVMAVKQLRMEIDGRELARVGGGGIYG